jgi:hypothetical protein
VWKEFVLYEGDEEVQIKHGLTQLVQGIPETSEDV